MKQFLLSLTIVVAINAAAQLNESFNDGNFTVAPAWSGSTASWQVVTSSDVSTGATNSNTLRLDVSSGSGTEYLSTQVLGSWGTQQTWGFWLGRRGQAATTSNISYVWLYASEADVTSTTVDGYRIRFGDNSGGDEIALESITNGAATAILTSTAAVKNGLADIGFLVRITKSSTGLWSLFTSTLPTADGEGAIATDVPNATNANVAQGTVTNTDYTTFDDGYIAIAALHSSGSAPRNGAEFDQIRFSFVAGSTLPVKFETFDAKQFNNSVLLKWVVATEENVKRYEVERSLDGRSFSNIGFVNAQDESNYSFQDNKLSSISYYRIKSVDFDGRYGYSTVAMVKSGKTMIVLKAFPTPFVKNVSIQHPTANSGSLITIFSQDGRTVKTIVPSIGTQQTDVDLSSAKAGLYIIRYNNGKGEVETLNILKQ